MSLLGDPRRSYGVDLLDSKFVANLVDNFVAFFRRRKVPEENLCKPRLFMKEWRHLGQPD